MSGEVVYSDVKFAKKGKKDKEARSSQEEDVTYSQVQIGTALRAVAEARSSQDEDVTYSQVKKSTAQRSPKAAEAGSPQEEDVTYSEIQIGSKPQKAPERRSRCTKRVVLLVVTAVFVLAVIAIIIISILKTQSKEKSDAQKLNITTPPPEQSTGKTEAPQTSTTSISPTTTSSTTTSTTTTSTTTTSTTTTSPITSCTNIMVPCAEDWELHGEKCYYFSPNAVKLSWTNSRERCKQLSGNLVKIESKEEQTFLYNKLRGLMTKDEGKFWIGLTDSETEGVWKWTDGSHLNTSSAFWFNDTLTSQNIKEPDNWTHEDPKGEDCVRMGERGDGFELNCWFDKSCIKENRFICEKQASISPNCK